MKIGIIANVAPRAILEHLQNGILGDNEDVGGFLVENVMQDAPEGRPVINTCIGAKVLDTSDEHLSAFHELVGVVQTKPDAFLYGILSPTKVSDFMEMSICNRFMVGGVGPTPGAVQGCGLPCGPEVYQAFPKLEVLVDYLHQIQYSGEVCIGITKDFQICSITFGHSTIGFSLFTELSQQSPQANLEFAFGKRDTCKLHSVRIAIATLMSYPPFPYTDSVPFSVLAPHQAERHMYRFNVGNSELAYASSSGDTLYEARRRLRRTLDNCKNYRDDLQYRIDAGKYLEFPLSQEDYKSKGGFR